jgi:LysM repeat protein
LRRLRRLTCFCRDNFCRGPTQPRRYDPASDLAALMEIPTPIARYAAIGALVVAFVVIIVLIGSSLGGSDSESSGSRQPAGQKQSKSKGSGSTDRKVYVVKPGDCCLSQIAEKTGMDIEELEQLNPGLDPQAIHSGDRVKLR